MQGSSVWSAVFLVVAAPAAAFAHGGQYSGPAGQPSGGPQVPPGTADPPAPTTRWETWWASNKEYFLRLAEEMRKSDGPTSRGLSGAKDGAQASPQDLREKRDAAVRESLVPIFVEALTDESFEVRTAAAIALGKTGAAIGSKPLREASMKDKHKDVRDSAILALGLLGRQIDIPFLDARLADDKENARHRAFAAFSLGLIGGEDAAASLLAFADGKPDKPSTFGHEPAALVASTYVAMGFTGDPQVLPVLRSALSSPNSHLDNGIRSFVVLALGRLKDRESLGEFGRMLVGDKDPGMRRSAAIALGKIAKADDKATVDGLLAAAKGDPDEIVRQFSAISLGGIANEDIQARLVKLFDEATVAGRPFLALALAIAHDYDAAPMLRTALAKETDESIKSSYCIALALLHDVASAPLLEKQVEDRGRIWLQGYAALGLGMLRHVESADMLYARLTTDNDARLRANMAVALGLMHDPRAKTYLVATLKKGDSTVYERGGAAMGMGVLRMSEAVTDILDVYRNKKEQDLVRAFSMVALGLIADPAPVPKLSRFAIDNNYTLAIDPLNEVLSIL